MGASKIRAALAALVEPGGTYELRVLDAGRSGTASGYFDDLDALALVSHSVVHPGPFGRMGLLTPTTHPKESPDETPS